MEDMKQKYLDSIRQATESLGRRIEVKEFLYDTILNKKYDQLILQHKDLNKDICKAIIYGRNLNNTDSALNILYAFIYFYIGSKVKIQELIEQFNDSPWDTYFNMCLYFIEGNSIKSKLYKTKFQEILKLSRINLDQDKIQQEIKLSNIRNATQIIDNLIKFFKNDITVTQKNKKNHFKRSYKFLKKHNMIKEIKDKTKDLKIQIITEAFLYQKYEFLKNIEIKEKNSLAIILYELVSVDYKQLSVFFSRCDCREKDNHLQQIKTRAYVDGDYFKLVQVGRSLKKICEWERTINLYEELIGLSQTNQNLIQYKVYLYFTICKIRFMKGELKSALKYCNTALEEIIKLSKSKELFYQPNKQRFIQLELLFMNLVLLYILRDNKSLIRIINYINFINLDQKLDSSKQKRPLNLVYQLFVEHIQINDISKIKYAEQTYKQIINFFGNKIKQKDNGIKQIINVKEIKLKTQCLLELFIMTQFIKSQKYQMVDYLNRDYLNLFLNIMIKLKDLDIEPSMQQQVFKQVFKNKNIEQPQIDDQVSPQIQRDSDFKVRNDIWPLYNEIKKELAPYYINLFPQIEKFLYFSNKYEIESQKLIDGMQVEEEISSGLFYRVNRANFQGQQYAYKISTITYHSKAQVAQNYQELEQLNSTINEINTISEIQDYKIPYVIQIKHIGYEIKQQSDTGLQRLNIFYLSPIYKPFSFMLTQSDENKLQFAEKIAICLKQLQIKRISNYHLEPESLLVDENNDPILNGFGGSNSDFIAKQNQSSIQTKIYVDPEIQNQGKKNRKSDVYSFGIILYYLFVRRKPFDDISQHNRNQFLSHPIHQQEIQKLKLELLKIQQLINNCAQSNSSKRLSLSQVLYQFLMMNPCRNDITKLLQVLMIDFPDIDITEQEFELIKEFIKFSFSQSLLLMETSELSQIERMNDTLQKFQYYDKKKELKQYSLVSQKYEIKIQNQQVAFRQILQCMRLIRNLIHLNQQCVKDITKFYNYQLYIQENGQEKSIFFDVFCIDQQYQVDYLKCPQSLINLLIKIQEINKDGIFMMALDQQFLYQKNKANIPVIFNFLYSQRRQDDILKNQYGWQHENYHNQNIQINNDYDLIKIYLKRLLNQLNDENKTCQLKEVIQDMIDKENQFSTIKQMIKQLTFKKIDIIQNPTIYSDRSDINQFCQIVYQIFVPSDPGLADIIQQFILSTKKYKKESSELNSGLKIDKKKIGGGNQAKVKKVHFSGDDYAQKISTISYQSDKPEKESIQVLKSRLVEINIMSYIEDQKLPYVSQNIHIGFIFKQIENITRIKFYNLTPIYRPFSFMQNQNDLNLKIIFSKKIAIGLLQLQMNAISHQDIKPDNLLVDDQNNPVIIDFGISIPNFKTSLTDKQQFTLVYADPQLVYENGFSRKNDVYSYGITIYELFTCSKPQLMWQGQEFLQFKAHQENIQQIQILEIQQLIQKCAQPLKQNRFSLCQILYKFLAINLHRKDITSLLNLFMDKFDDVHITEQEYQLIEQFQLISLLIPQMDSLEIQQVQEINGTLNKCYYQDQTLYFHQYQIQILDKQLAFRQILQCMRFISNLVDLNKKKITNISQFYNYRLIVKQNDLDQSILFEIFFYDNNYQQGYLKYPKQVISLLKTIQQIHDNGVLLMNFQDSSCLLYQNDTPILINFLYSIKQKEDLFKNQYGWSNNYIINFKDELKKSYDLQIIKIYFEHYYNFINRQAKINQQQFLFNQQLHQVIQNFQDFTNIKQILKSILVNEIAVIFQ